MGYPNAPVKTVVAIFKLPGVPAHLLPLLTSSLSIFSSNPALINKSDSMTKSFTLIETVAAAGVFSAVSFWYGFMFGRESSRKELGSLIEDLRRGNGNANAGSNVVSSPDA